MNKEKVGQIVYLVNNSEVEEAAKFCLDYIDSIRENGPFPEDYVKTLTELLTQEQQDKLGEAITKLTMERMNNKKEENLEKTDSPILETSQN